MRFILLHALTRIERERSARATATFPAHLELFADHFPGFPIVPGVLLTETMCQTAGWLIAASQNFVGWPLVARIDRANFRRVVSAGDPLVIDATLTAAREETFEIQASVSVNGQVVADARLLFRLFPYDAAPERGAALRSWGQATFEQLGGPDALVAGGP